MQKYTELKRAWINQPSTLQDYHHLHGTNVLMMPEKESSSCQIYFLSGDIVSQRIPKLTLSKGWLKHTQPINA